MQLRLHCKLLDETAKLYIKYDKPLPTQFEFSKDKLEILSANPAHKSLMHEMEIWIPLLP